MAYSSSFAIPSRKRWTQTVLTLIPIIWQCTHARSGSNHPIRLSADDWTIAYTNANNLFGISEDLVQLTGKRSKNQLVTAGGIGSKLNNYFNASCVTTPPVIGADGIDTAFGNSGTGIVDGPGQANLDLALSKTVALKWPLEISSLPLRAEFYNPLNHPQFSNPDANFSSPTFGVVTSTAVNPRVVQLALRFSF